MRTHKELYVWQKSMDFAEEIYRLVKLLPGEEKYVLSDQMRRAAVSIPSNIAEGNARESEKDFLRFLSITQGSNAEIETQLLLCGRFGYLPSDKLQNALTMNEEIAKMLRGLKTSIQSAINEKERAKGKTNEGGIAVS